MWDVFRWLGRRETLLEATPITWCHSFHSGTRRSPMELLLNFVYTVASALYTALFVNGSR
ncbi:hypothetical protein OPAG_04602 [Rhodococcus opacus PD630]|nr:hypothetical protein OPAG_04602 [Rhodococcus opacus PD630]